MHDAYATPAKLLDRVALYDFLERPSDLVMEIIGLFAAVGSGEHLLDVGCGPGRYLAALRRERPDLAAVGVDLSPGMAAAARQHGPAVAGDALNLPFRTGAFSAVLAAHMLYHLPDVAAGAAELARVCSPQGRVVLVTNGPDHLRELREEFARAAGQPLPPSPADRFQLDNGPALIAGSLVTEQVERRRNRIVLTDAQPAVTYLDSARDYYEPHLRRPWPEVRRRLRASIQARVRSEGTWSAQTDGGTLVCRPAVA